MLSLVDTPSKDDGGKRHAEECEKQMPIFGVGVGENFTSKFLEKHFQTQQKTISLL